MEMDSNLSGITAAGTGAIGGLTVKGPDGVVVGTAGSISSIDLLVQVDCVIATLVLLVWQLLLFLLNL